MQGENEPQIEESATAASGRRQVIFRRVAHGVLAGGVVVAIAALTVGGIAALQYRASEEIEPLPHPAIAVSAKPVKFQDRYPTTVRYIGRLEPARQTELSFEQSGLVVEVGPDEGDTVLAGDVVARLDTDRLEASRAQLEAQKRELEAERKFAELTLGRQSDLRKKGWSARQTEDEAIALVAQLSAAIDRVDAQIELVDIDVRKSVLVAPYDGTIGARDVDEGAVVSAGTPVASLLETGHPQARIGLPPDVARSLDGDIRYEIELGSRKIPATVVSLRPDLQTQTQTVPVLFDLETAGDMPFREVVALVLEKDVKERGVWLPLNALKEGRKGLWTVLVVEELAGDMKVRSEVVELLHLAGERAYVRGTLTDGARVVMDGTHRVVPGQQVALSEE